MRLYDCRGGYTLGVLVLGLGLAVAGIFAGNLKAQTPAAAPAPAAAATPAAAAAATPAPAAPVPAAAVPAPAAKVYRRWAYDEKLKRNATLVTKLLAGSETSTALLPTFDEYYEKFSIGRWTEPSGHNLLPKYRNELRSNLQTAKSGPIHDRLTNLIMRMMTEAAFANDFDPVVRVNAMLMIGELNTEDTSKPNTPPVPLGQAVPTLVRAVRDTNLIDPVKVAALAGLLRHARLGIASQQAADVSAAMTELIRAKNIPSRTAAGYAWLRARAAEILGAQTSVGAGNAIADLLADLAADSSSQLLLRRTAAEALSSLNYQGAANLNTDKLATALAAVAVASVEAASQEVEAKKTGVYRAMKSGIYAALAGINAVAPVAAGGKASQVQAKLQQMVAAMEKTNDDAVVATVAPLAAELKPLAAAQ